MHTLDLATLGTVYLIDALLPSPTSPERKRQLMELGFIAGEQVKVLRRTQPGADPLVVRVGISTFALRKTEASCIAIRPLTETFA